MMAADNYAQSQTFEVLSGFDQILSRLSDSNRSSLLAASSDGAQRRQSEATAILKRLGELNASLVTQFESKQDVLSDVSLRMVRSSRSKSDSVTSFIVVSYCWHYPDWKLAQAAKPISAGWGISIPMMKSVMGLRADDDEGVWIDKLCINQDDNADKVAHTGVMDAVYRAARRMVILLEDVQLTKEEEEAGLVYSEFYKDMVDQVRDDGLVEPYKSKFIEEYFPKREKLFQDEGKSHILAEARPFVINLLSARWFTRAWCAHESRVVPHGKVNNPLFLCFGHHGNVLKFEFRFVHYLALLFYRIEPLQQGLSLTDNINTMYDPNLVSLQGCWWRIQRFYPNDDDYEVVSAMEEFTSIMILGCSMKGDMVSIALNTSGIPLVFRGTLASTTDALWVFAAVVLAKGDLGPLISNGQTIKDVDDKGHNTTSWLCRSIETLPFEEIPAQSTESITSITKDYVELDLLVFMSLPLKASTTSMTKASVIIKKHDLRDPGIPIPSSKNAVATNTMKLIAKALEEEHNISMPLVPAYLQIWVAIALDSGLDWIRHFPDSMHRATEKMWRHGTLGVGIDTTLTDPALSLLSNFGITADNNSDFERKYLHPCIKFFTCIMDNRMKFLCQKPRRVPVSHNDSAILYSTTNRSWTAVPVALAHLPACYNRAWTIEPFDPASDTRSLGHMYSSTDPEEWNDEFEICDSDFGDRRAEKNECGTWLVRKKGVIFGCQALTSPVVVDGHNVVLLKKQRIYGADDYDWGVIDAVLKKQHEILADQIKELKLERLKLERLNRVIKRRKSI